MDKPTEAEIRENGALTRLDTECAELLDRKNNLATFLHSPSFDVLPDQDRHLLLMQYPAMDAYWQIVNFRRVLLRDRISRRGKPVDNGGEILDEGVRFARPDEAEPLPFGA